MYKPTHYVSKQPDQSGYIYYEASEHKTWRELYQRQLDVIQKRACEEYIQGLQSLALDPNEVPQLPDVNHRLQQTTGWQVQQVPALIQFKEFFYLLANKKFPAATFIRTTEDLDYIKEPDIFHELYGHCPLLTNPAYAAFMQKYGKLGLQANHKQQVKLARLYWFTVEFGLIHTTQGIRIYGGGILSSKNETQYAIDSDIPLRKNLAVLEALRTPYRIDILQPIYFVIENFNSLYELVNIDLLALIAEAVELGELPPMFQQNVAEQNKKGIHYE